MLELKDIRKVYRVGELETRAVDGITVSFREKEFVAVLAKAARARRPSSTSSAGWTATTTAS